MPVDLLVFVEAVLLSQDLYLPMSLSGILCIISYYCLLEGATNTFQAQRSCFVSYTLELKVISACECGHLKGCYNRVKLMLLAMPIATIYGTSQSQLDMLRVALIIILIEVW